MKKLTEQELIALARQIACASACTTDFDALVGKFEESVPYPNASQLIFDPPGGAELPLEEVVRIALQWKPDSDHF